jgi:hypothetical protein
VITFDLAEIDEPLSRMGSLNAASPLLQVSLVLASAVSLSRGFLANQKQKQSSFWTHGVNYCEPSFKRMPRVIFRINANSWPRPSQWISLTSR